MPDALALARAVLGEITPPGTIGTHLDTVEAEGVSTLYFEANMAGYAGWRWTVSVATVDGAEPTVLETELTPGDGALLAPEWVPWADRLEDWRAAQAAAGVEGAEDDDETDDDEVLDDDDFDDDPFESVDVDDIVDEVEIEEVEIDLDEAQLDAAPEADVDEAEQPEPDTDQGRDERDVTRARRRRAKNQ